MPVSAPVLEPAPSSSKIYQYCHISRWKTHLTVISIPYQRPPVTSVGRRAAVPCARLLGMTPAAVWEASGTNGDCRSAMPARARERPMPDAVFIKRESTVKIIKTMVAALALGLSAMTVAAQAEDKGLVGVLMPTKT